MSNTHIPPSHGARDVLHRLLQKTFGGDAVAFMNECFQMVLDEQPGLWLNEEELWEALQNENGSKPRKDQPPSPSSKSEKPRERSTSLDSGSPKVTHKKSKKKKSSRGKKESQKRESSTVIDHSHPKLAQEQSESSEPDIEVKDRGTIGKSKSKRKLSCLGYESSAHITSDDKQALCAIDNIRNMTYGQWCQVETLPAPEGASPYHISGVYDANRLKEIWVGVCPYFVWITFCFVPSDPSKVVPSAEFEEVDPYYRKQDCYEYLCLTVETVGGKKHFKASRSSTTKHDLVYTFRTEADVINQLRSCEDYPFPIQIFPILEPVKNAEEAQQRREKARKFFMLVCQRVQSGGSERSRQSGTNSIMSLSKEVGVDMEIPSWASNLFSSPAENALKALWKINMIRTSIESYDAARIAFTVNGILEAYGVLKLPWQELPRLLHANLRDNIDPQP